MHYPQNLTLQMKQRMRHCLIFSSYAGTLRLRLRLYQHRRAQNSFNALKMFEYSQYNIGVPAEALWRYCPGGYHPIHLNDTLKDGQYEILHKLGFGSFATVWLARDNR